MQKFFQSGVQYDKSDIVWAFQISKGAIHISKYPVEFTSKRPFEDSNLRKARN